MNNAYFQNVKLENAVIKNRHLDRFDFVRGQMVFDGLLDHFNGNIAQHPIGIWGLASSPDDRSFFDSPAVELIQLLLGVQAQITVHDPSVMDQVESVFGHQINYSADQWNAALGADALVILSPCKHYVGADAGLLRWYLRHPTLFDPYCCLRLEKLRFGKFAYYSSFTQRPNQKQRFVG